MKALQGEEHEGKFCTSSCSNLELIINGYLPATSKSRKVRSLNDNPHSRLVHSRLPESSCYPLLAAHLHESEARNTWYLQFNPSTYVM